MMVSPPLSEFGMQVLRKRDHVLLSQRQIKHTVCPRDLTMSLTSSTGLRRLLFCVMIRVRPRSMGPWAVGT
jgi:hypothetical protein